MIGFSVLCVTNAILIGRGDKVNVNIYACEILFFLTYQELLNAYTPIQLYFPLGSLIRHVFGLLSNTIALVVISMSMLYCT